MAVKCPYLSPPLSCLGNWLCLNQGSTENMENGHRMGICGVNLQRFEETQFSEYGHIWQFLQDSKSFLKKNVFNTVL